VNVLTTRAPRPWRGTRAWLVAGCTAALLAVWAAPPLYLLPVLALIGSLALVLRYPPVGFALLAFSVPWGSRFTVHIGSFPLTTTEIVVGELSAAWLASASYYRRSPLTRLWTPYLIFYLAVIALSATQSIDRQASYREIFKWLELGVVYYSAAYLLRSRRHLQLVVDALVLAGVSQALLGFAQLAFQLGPAAFGLHRTFFRSYGTFDQPNPYAGFLNMVLPLAVALALDAGTRRRRGWYRLASVLLVGALLASQSRGALIAAGVALAVVLGCRSQRTARLAWTGALAALLGALLAAFNLLPAAPVNRILTAVGLGEVSFNNVTDANFSAVERAAHWLAGVRMFAAHPLLGVGIGNYGAAYPAYHPRGWYASLDHAHNYYINIAAEAGVFGLAAYALWLGSALWYSYASARLEHDRAWRALLLGVLGGLVTTSVHNLFDVLYVHGMTALFGLLLALIPASRAIELPTTGTEQQVTKSGAIYA